MSMAPPACASRAFHGPEEHCKLQPSNMVSCLFVKGYYRAWVVAALITCGQWIYGYGTDRKHCAYETAAITENNRQSACLKFIGETARMLFKSLEKVRLTN